MATFRVSNQSQLNSALNNVKDGDTVLLASGTYSNISMMTDRRTDHDFASKVTIKSENPNNPAKVNKLLLNNVSNVEFSDIVFDYVRGRTSTTPFFVEKSDGITFDDVVFDGDYKDGYASGIGLRVKGSTDVAVTDSVFRNFGNGIDFSNNTRVTLTGNDIRGVSNDGFTFGGIKDMLIADNDFREYRSQNAYSLHKDHIQFRAGGTEAASQDIVIRDNVFVDKELRHGIFFGNEAYRNGQTSYYYQDITVEGNYLSTAHVHGITVFYGTDIEIANNTLVKNSGMTRNGDLYVPLINVSKYSTDVSIHGNTVASVQTPQDGSWSIFGNIVSGRRYKHWDGTEDMFSRTTVKAGANAASTTLATTASTATESAAAEESRVDGRDVDGATRFAIDGLDFGGGDTLVLSHFERGTFQGISDENALAIWDNSRAVRIDALADVRELDRASSDVTVDVSDDTLILQIQQDDGLARIALDGHGHAYEAAYLL